MYAVVATGGKQYRVEAGNMLEVELLPGEIGASVTFDRVLMIGDGEQVTVGTPIVPGATVSATVMSHARGPKLVIFKFKQKVKYRRRTGHRQHLTQVRIDAIHPTAVTKSTAKPKAAAHAAPAEQAPVEKAAATPKAAKPRAPRAKAPSAKVAADEASATPPKPRSRRTAPAKE